MSNRPLWKFSGMRYPIKGGQGIEINTEVRAMTEPEAMKKVAEQLYDPNYNIKWTKIEIEVGAD